jgi:hypothetical protein
MHAQLPPITRQAAADPRPALGVRLVIALDRFASPAGQTP